jgi:hypothetical protein
MASAMTISVEAGEHAGSDAELFRRYDINNVPISGPHWAQ